MAGDPYRDVFIAEARELTAALEQDLVDLEGKSGDGELISRIFRAAHTMKSSAAMFGFPEIASLTHAMESVLDRVRDHVLAIDAAVVNTLLDALDCLRQMVNEATEGTSSDHSEALAPLCERLLQVAAGATFGPAAVSPPAGVEPKVTTYQIHLALNDDVFFQGTSPTLLLDELATLGHVIEVRCDTSRVPEICEIDPLKLYLSWDITLTSTAARTAVEEVFLFCRNDGDIHIAELTDGPPASPCPCTGSPAAKDGSAIPVAAVATGVQEGPASTAPRLVAAPVAGCVLDAAPRPVAPLAPATPPAAISPPVVATPHPAAAPPAAATPLTGALAEGAEATGLEAVAKLPADDLEILHDFYGESAESLAAVEEKILALEADPTDLETIHALFRTFHSMKGSAGFLQLEVLGKLAHETENMLDRARNGALLFDDNSIALLLTSIDLARGLNDNIGAFLEKGAIPADATLRHLRVGDHVAMIRRFLAGARPVVEPPKPIGKILVERGAVAPADVGEAVTEQLAGSPNTLGTILVDKGKVTPEKVGEALAEQRAQAVQPAVQKTISAIRVDTERLDAMMNSVGEIVIAQSHALKLATEMEGEHAERLQTALYEVERLSRNLQDVVMGVRMMPIGPTFKQFARFVRDSSRELGKEVNFVVTGEETELDKTVIEKIGDPLKHLIRNSLDHGLETPEERLAAGKSAKGTLELKAAHEGGSVIIEVIDDGHGIRRDKVLAKAIAKGLVAADQEVSDEQIRRLIFQPGFSTAEQVSALSGRGVGMDVVKRNVDELRGSVDIESEEGKGSVLRIRLPLTLAIIEGMVVSVSGQPYIVPVLAIVESIRPRPQDIQHVAGQGEVLFFRNEYLPLYRLYEWLGHEPRVTQPEKGIVLVVEDRAGRRALLADDLLGQQQVVIKNLEDNFTKLPGISGATILAEGNVALILDLLGLYDYRQAAAGGVVA